MNKLDDMLEGDRCNGIKKTNRAGRRSGTLGTGSELQF